MNKIKALISLQIIKEKNKRLEDAVFRMKGELAKLDTDLERSNALTKLNLEMQEIFRVKAEDRMRKANETEKAYEEVRMLNLRLN